MKRATSTPAGLNVKKITAYLKGQAKSRNAVRITCQSGSVYIITGYAAFKLPVFIPATAQYAGARRRCHSHAQLYRPAVLTASPGSRREYREIQYHEKEQQP